MDSGLNYFCTTSDSKLAGKHLHGDVRNGMLFQAVTLFQEVDGVLRKTLSNCSCHFKIFVHDRNNRQK